MKTSFLISVLACSFFLFTVNSCKKHKNNVQSELSKLPPETQSGANTFGCLINGIAFLPKGSGFSGPKLSCSYIENTTSQTGYFFNLSANDFSNPNDFPSVGIFTDSVQILPEIFLLSEKFVAGKSYGQYGRYIIGQNPDLYNTNSIVTGELTRKYLDEINQIVSGTFWFNAVDKNADTIKITDGRFDMKFTK